MEEGKKPGSGAQLPFELNSSKPRASGWRYADCKQEAAVPNHPSDWSGEASRPLLPLRFGTSKPELEPGLLPVELPAAGCWVPIHHLPLTAEDIPSPFTQPSNLLLASHGQNLPFTPPVLPLTSGYTSCTQVPLCKYPAGVSVFPIGY